MTAFDMCVDVQIPKITASCCQTLKNILHAIKADVLPAELKWSSTYQRDDLTFSASF